VQAVLARGLRGREAEEGTTGLLPVKRGENERRAGLLTGSFEFEFPSVALFRFFTRADGNLFPVHPSLIPPRMDVATYYRQRFPCISSADIATIADRRGYFVITYDEGRTATTRLAFVIMWKT